MQLPKLDKLEQNGKRIYIRPLRLSDISFWKESQDAMSVPQSKFDIPPARKPGERTIKTFRGILKANKTIIRKGTDCFWGVFLKNNRLIGRVGMMNITRDAYQSAEITYRIFNPFWGHGYAQEAIEACLKLAFTELGLNRIEAYVEPVNIASIRAARASGFKKEGLARKKLFTRKAWRNVLVYSAVCSDYGFKFNPPEL
jgi:ribosomal-protein-alanine N-acetyltransferase